MKIIDLEEEPLHIPTLAQWHHAQWAYLNPAGSIDARIEKMKTHLSAELVPSTFIAIDNNLLGSASIVTDDMDTHPELTPWLASVYVAPEYRHRGVGEKLVRHVMQCAQDAGIEKLYLFTPDRRAFYEYMNWQLLSIEIYRGQSVAVMEIDLSK